jgi:hypothetical protein
VGCGSELNRRRCTPSNWSTKSFVCEQFVGASAVRDRTRPTRSSGVREVKSGIHGAIG